MLGRVGVISLEPWDEVWRRNQHLAAQLVRQGLAASVVFVAPPVLRPPAAAWVPEPGITVVTPRLRVPKRLGGLRLLGSQLRRGPLAGVDVLWVNDPRLGAACLRRAVPTAYDVTDDWRSAPSLAARREQLVAAEDLLARRATTVVCSDVLAARWRSRYGVDPVVVHNGVDLDAWAGAVPQRLDGPGPHLVYVGTLHADRIDLDLVVALARGGAGTVHLVGPDALTDDERAPLLAAGVRLEGRVAAAAVPGWMLAADVLVSPHLVDDFTLSLDAIKAREYAVAGRPVVATPTSGFAPPAILATGADFVAAAWSVPPAPPAETADLSWPARAREFATALAAA